MKSSRVPSSQRFAGLQHCVVVYQLPDWHLVQPFLLLHLLDCKQQTALAAISCRVWTAFSKYWVAPPHTVIRYTILLIMAPYAIINFGWKVEFLPILFKPLTLYVSFLISEHWWGESCQGLLPATSLLLFINFSNSLCFSVRTSDSTLGSLFT